MELPSTPHEHKEKPSWLRAWLQLIRSGNVLLSGAASSVGVFLAGGNPDAVRMIGAVLAPVLVSAAGNIDNDYCDQRIDRLSRPDRPLVTGAVAPSSARRAALILYVLGASVGLLCGWRGTIVAVGAAMILVLYNRGLSSVLVVGNGVIALLGALPILYGAIGAAGEDYRRWTIAALGALVAFWLHFAREILKDVLDREGDALSSRRTVALADGPVVATRVAAAPMVAAAASSLWLGIGGWMGPLYLFGVLTTIIPALLLGAAQCGLNPSDGQASRWSGALKLCMAAGLAWLILGRMGR